MLNNNRIKILSPDRSVCRRCAGRSYRVCFGHEVITPLLCGQTSRERSQNAEAQRKGSRDQKLRLHALLKIDRRHTEKRSQCCQHDWREPTDSRVKDRLTSIGTVFLFSALINEIGDQRTIVDDDPGKTDNPEDAGRCEI
ncbi:MAG: hypothetical protein AAF764_03930 [Pseudomonadota bacterium]